MDDDEDFVEWSKEHRYALDYKTLFSYVQQTEEWKNTDQPLRFVEERIRRHLRDYIIDDGSQVTGKIELSHAGPQWIRVGSVFITLLRKEPQHTVDDLLDHLTQSLENWNPSFMRLMLAYARAGVVDQGISGDDRLLRDAENEAAWIFYTDESADFHERRERVGILYARLVDDLLAGTLDRLLDFSKAHGGEQLPKVQDRLKHAMQRLGLAADDATTQRRVIHKVNHYLAFERVMGRHLRAGTVFKDQDNRYGVVTTPDCDLVPGRNRGLGATLRVIYRPAFVVTKSGKITEAYDRAADFKHMFLHVPDESIADGYLVLGLHSESGKPSDHPAAGILYVADDGRIDSQRCFTAQSVALNEQGSLVLAPPSSFRALAQLRDRYALRLLHEAGHHLSRTGVDFVPWK